MKRAYRGDVPLESWLRNPERDPEISPKRLLDKVTMIARELVETIGRDDIFELGEQLKARCVTAGYGYDHLLINHAIEQATRQRKLL